MKRRFWMLLLLTVCLTGCIGPGASDWSYELPNGYAIWRISSRSIKCLKAEGSSGTGVLDRYVCAFCYDDRYVGLQCADVPQDLNEQIETGNPDYYLLDTVLGTLSGPHSLEEYKEKTEELEKLCPWISTKPTPEGASYD